MHNKVYVGKEMALHAMQNLIRWFSPEDLIDYRIVEEEMFDEEIRNTQAH